MKAQSFDLVIVGAGPVGLMCAYLARLSGLSAIVLDKSEAPLEVGRADALNARTLQLLELAGLFGEIYPLGKPCNTSSVWKDGRFVSRQSAWWDDLEGCFHRHFLMLGQSFLEKSLDAKLRELGASVRRRAPVERVEVTEEGCRTTLVGGELLESKYVVGADGSRSLVRELFGIPFVIERPQIVWAVIDAELETDFPKVPEIIVFQADTSDVAWIPREGAIDRFYVRMDTKDFTLEDAMAKVNRATWPHAVSLKKLVWFSRFSVKESVAESYFVRDRVFLAGDAAHIHSVNGGQGLNTGLADAFNLIWKLALVLKRGAPSSLLASYESERKPVAVSVIESSGELVRSTKYSATGTHAEDYVKIVERRAGNITGMGIRYGRDGLDGQRLPDFELRSGGETRRIYSLLDYSRYTLLVFGVASPPAPLPDYVRRVDVPDGVPTAAEAILVRPDGYIAAHGTLAEMSARIETPEALVHGL